MYIYILYTYVYKLKLQILSYVSYNYVVNTINATDILQASKLRSSILVAPIN